MRYAIYAAPGTEPAGAVPAGAVQPDAAAPDPAGALLRERAESWLGRSSTAPENNAPENNAGEPVTPGVPAGWTRGDVDAITVSARRYGFHATLKAPFRLAADRTPQDLQVALERFAAQRAAVTVPRLSLACLGGGFFALVPGAAAPELYALAADIVAGFDRFRAPATDAEIARRDPDRLTPRQRELLHAWGYHYVLDEFRFHLTLTDPVPVPRRPETERVLRDWFAASIGAALTVDALALFTEAEPGAPFRLQAVYPLQAARSSPPVSSPPVSPAAGNATRPAGNATETEGAR
ncbi:MAG TPA: DUF1045 domain-containing protein [Trebonia sp.]|jgi:hypothetical protein